MRPDRTIFCNLEYRAVFYFLVKQLSIIKGMKNYIGIIEVIIVPEEGKRFLIHLNKPDINLLKKVKRNRENENLPVGKYYITEDFRYESQRV